MPTLDRLHELVALRTAFVGGLTLARLWLPTRGTSLLTLRGNRYYPAGEKSFGALALHPVDCGRHMCRSDAAGRLAWIETGRH